jgi:hypothetical protein
MERRFISGGQPKGAESRFFKQVIQVFKYCFQLFVNRNRRLQDYIGWDDEFNTQLRRMYSYVLFLKDPAPTIYKAKEYIQDAFGLSATRHLLAGQRYFDDKMLLEAMSRTGSSSPEMFLGIVHPP